MRRLRETGIVTIMLLSLSGCAGLEQRLGWTEPPYVGDEGSEERPLSRLAFWRRQRTEEANPAALAPGSSDATRSPMVAGNGASTEDDEERPGLLRRLPLVGRLWRADDRDDSDAMEVARSRYTLSPAATAFVPPRAPAAATAFVPPRTPAAAAPVQAAQAASAPAAALAGDTTAALPGPGRSLEDAPLRELTADLGGTKPQVDSAAVPARNPGSPAPPDSPRDGSPAAASAPPIPGATGPEAQQGGAAAPTAAPGPEAEVAPGLSPAVNPNRGPSLPSPAVEPPPTAGSAPASGVWSSTVVSTPGPIWPVAGQVLSSGSSQAMVVSSPQAGYISSGCDATCGCSPKCKKHSLCPFKKHKQQVIASSVVLPSAQGIISSCEATLPCKVKKPCFLKTWLHHKAGCKSKACKGCKSCTYCGEPAVVVSAQGPIISPQQ
jgi:hypothetical protein